MATPIFRVDLSKDARDFQPTATEPGLGMLDRQRANFIIMRRWFGRLVAEPAWQGKDRVAFYVQAEEEDARIENVDCYPVTKSDLEGPLNEEFKTIAARIKRAKPTSDAEQSLHRVVRQTFNGMTRDLEESDFDCFLFKYREGKGPWHLLWCWGYQRADQEPATSLVCTNSDCNQLFVRRESEKANCPGCATVASGRRRPSAGGFLGSSRNRRMVGGLLLLLLVALLLGMFLGRPKLVVSPGDWTGPQGKKVAYKIEHKRWFIFTSDVTDQVKATSDNQDIFAFNGSAASAVAKQPGETEVSFRLGDLATDAKVTVQDPLPPDELKIEPGNVNLAVGATQQLKVMGHYDAAKEIEPVDFTNKAGFEIGDPEIVSQKKGLLEALKEGSTGVTASYQHAGEGDTLTAAVDLKVVRGEYKSLEISLDPKELARGQRGKFEVFAIDAGGNKYSLLGSSQLHVSVIPKDSATVEGGYITGKLSGEAVVTANLGDLAEALTFNITDQSSLAAGTFIVTPQQAEMVVHEFLKLDVTSASTDPIEAVSSDPAVVEVLRGAEVVARAKGNATITVKQGDKTKEIQLTVVDEIIDRLKIVPSIINLQAGKAQTFRVLGVREDDNGLVIREFDIAPDRLFWYKRPTIKYIYFDDKGLILKGLQPTPKAENVIVMLGEDLSAAANVKVTGVFDPLALDDFMAHPPIGGRFSLGAYLGDKVRVRPGVDGLLIDEVLEGSPLYNARLRPGTRIVRHGDVDLLGMTEDELAAYFRKHPIIDGDVIHYVDPDGNTGIYRFGNKNLVVDVVLKSAKALNLTATDFNAEIHLSLLRKGEYRVAIRDAEGNITPLTDWAVLGPNDPDNPNDLTVIITEQKMMRNANDEDEYVCEIHRKVGDAYKAYEIKFRLASISP